MKATFLLADAAQADNKVHALGLGWTVVGTPLPAHALVVIFHADWHEANTRHFLKIVLVDADGAPVELPGSDTEPGRFEVEGEFEVGRPAGLIRGTELVQPLVINVPPGMPLPAKQRYEYRLTVNDAELGGAVFSVLG